MVVPLSLRSSKACRKIAKSHWPSTQLTGDEPGMLSARDMRLTSISWHETPALDIDDDEVVFHLRKNLIPSKLSYASPSTFFLDCCTTSSDCFASFALSMSSPLSSSDGACQNGQRAPFHSFSMYLYTRPHARSHAIPSPRAINHPIFSVTYAFCLLAFLPSFLIFQINAQSIPSTSLERHKNNTSSTISHAFP